MKKKLCLNFLFVLVAVCTFQVLRVYTFPKFFFGDDFIKLMEQNTWLSGTTIAFTLLSVVVTLLVLALFLWVGSRLLFGTEPEQTPTYGRFLYATLCAEWVTIFAGAVLLLLYSLAIVPADVRAPADSLLYYFNIDKLDTWIQIPLRALSVSNLVYIAGLVFFICRTLSYSFRKSVDLTLCAYVFPSFVLLLLFMMISMLKAI